MADEEFHFSNGEILMKETFLIFFSGRKDILHDGKLFWVKKREKRNVKFRRSGTLSGTYSPVRAVLSNKRGKMDYLTVFPKILRLPLLNHVPATP